MLCLSARQWHRTVDERPKLFVRPVRELTAAATLDLLDVEAPQFAALVGLEDMDEEDVKRIEAEFAAIKARQARRRQEMAQHMKGEGQT
jgi:hypothetical protein